MVNKPLIRPYFLGGLALGGRRLKDSLDFMSDMNLAHRFCALQKEGGHVFEGKKK